jgi:hypothetical protein
MSIMSVVVCHWFPYGSLWCKSSWIFIQEEIDPTILLRMWRRCFNPIFQGTDLHHVLYTSAYDLAELIETSHMTLFIKNLIKFNLYNFRVFHTIPFFLKYLPYKIWLKYLNSAQETNVHSINWGKIQMTKFSVKGQSLKTGEGEKNTSIDLRVCFKFTFLLIRLS